MFLCFDVAHAIIVCLLMRGLLQVSGIQSVKYHIIFVLCSDVVVKYCLLYLVLYLVANHCGFDLLHNVRLFMDYAYTMRGVGSMAMTICTVSKIDIMATSVPLFSLVNATGISNCSKDIVEESCVVHQADVSFNNQKGATACSTGLHIDVASTTAAL